MPYDAAVARRPPPAPTKSQVNRSGRILRRWATVDALFIDDEVEEALLILDRFRAAHQYALTKATMGLRSMVNSAGCRIEVSQRLKRQVTILDKLVREPSMQLANMQDVGGCRAVLASIDEVRRVEHRLKKNRTPLRTYDYVAEPRPSGYRAVHVVVQYPDAERELRTIEVQLRTRVMHAWAITVERLSGRRHEDLKAGQGPPELLELLSVVSEAMAIEEAGEVVPQTTLDRIAELRKGTVGYPPRPPGTEGDPS